MIIRLFDKYIQDKGYVKIETGTPDIAAYIKKENSFNSILQLVDVKKSTALSHNIYTDICKEQSKRYDNAHIMSIVFFDECDKALQIVGDDYMCWLVDKHDISLLTEDNRIEDYYGFRQELINWLKGSKELIASGDMKAIDRMLMTEQEREKEKEIRKKKPSPVAVTILVVTSIIFLAEIIIGDAFIESGEMDRYLVEEGQYFRFITAIFLHGGLDHLICNMVLLYFLGEIIEHRVGSVRFAIIYFISGVIGNVVSYGYEVWAKTAYVSIGASGAVYGIMGALLYLVLRKTKNLNVPVKNMLLLVAYCIYSSFAMDHIDFAAHIGGMVAGFVITVVLCPKGVKNEG